MDFSKVIFGFEIFGYVLHILFSFIFICLSTYTYIEYSEDVCDQPILSGFIILTIIFCYPLFRNVSSNGMNEIIFVFLWFGFNFIVTFYNFIILALSNNCSSDLPTLFNICVIGILLNGLYIILKIVHVCAEQIYRKFICS